MNKISTSVPTNFNGNQIAADIRVLSHFLAPPTASENELRAVVLTKGVRSVAPHRPFVWRDVVAPIFMLAIPAPHHPIIVGE
jgi:hypothetical protein